MYNIRYTPPRIGNKQAQYGDTGNSSKLNPKTKEFTVPWVTDLPNRRECQTEMPFRRNTRLIQSFQTPSRANSTIKVVPRRREKVGYKRKTLAVNCDKFMKKPST